MTSALYHLYLNISKILSRLLFVFNFNKLVSELDIDAHTPDSRFRNSVSKGPKYRFPSHIDFNRRREEIASALNDFCNRRCKR